MHKSAVISSNEIYRYRLQREWEWTKPFVTFVMLNPSTADADIDDPTIKKCIKFAKNWGYGRIDVVNLFAFRATDPRRLKEQLDPVGAENDCFIKSTLIDTDLVVCAWGRHGKFKDRDIEAMKILHSSGKTAYSLKINKDGTPKHPLYCPDNSGLVQYSGRPINIT